MGHHPSVLSAHDAGLLASGDYAGLGKRSSMEDAQGMHAAGGKKKRGPKGKAESVSFVPPPVPQAPPEPPAQAKSLLHPPPQARSAWQIFFTDRLNEAKAKVGPGDKLNVAHVAKDAGAAYAALQGAEKEYYAQKAQEAREQYAVELAAWQATLTPEDVRVENQFRANQRKAGKSRKGNLKDPNAPKKPLSAYFLFLKAIRSSPELTRQVFEGETETTKQSMLAAKRWRSFNDEEKKPYLKQAELDKAEYDTLRKQYEEDAAARGRGETVPEREHVEPSYAKETVSPRLLAAVLPKTFDERMGGGGDSVAIDNTLDADVLAGTMHTEGDQSMEQGHDELKVEGVHAIDTAAGDMMNLVLPEGLDFTANFDLPEAGADDANVAFDFQAQALANLEQPKLEDVSAAPVNGQHEEQVKFEDQVKLDDQIKFEEQVNLAEQVRFEAVSAVSVNVGGDSTTTMQGAVVSAAVMEAPVVEAPETMRPTEVEAPPEEASSSAPKVEEIPADQSSEDEPDDVAGADEVEGESTGSVDMSPATEEDAASPIKAVRRSPTPEPDPAKIEAAAAIGVTTEAELAEDAAQADITPSMEEQPQGEAVSPVVTEPASESFDASAPGEPLEMPQGTETSQPSATPDATDTAKDSVVAEA